LTIEVTVKATAESAGFSWTALDEVELTESLFPPQTNAELSDITVGELLSCPMFFVVRYTT
jgi:hypothetical protein